LESQTGVRSASAVSLLSSRSLMVRFEFQSVGIAWAAEGGGAEVGVEEVAGAAQESVRW